MTKIQASSDLKLKAVKYYNLIKNYVKTCEIFECSDVGLKDIITLVILLEKIEKKVHIN